MVALSDPFAYSNGTIPSPPWSSPWSGFALPTVNAGHCEPAGAATLAYFCTHDTQCTSQVQISQAIATLQATTTYHESSVLVRQSTTGSVSGYQFAFHRDGDGTFHYSLWKNKPGGGFDTLGNTTAPAGPHSLRIKVDASNNIICKADGVTIFSVTDSTSPLTGTGVGFGVYTDNLSSVPTIDDWIGGDAADIHTFVELFGQANGAINSDWTATSGTPQISGGVVSLVASTDTNAVRTAETFGVDQECYADVTVSGAGFVWIAVCNTIDMTNLAEIVWGSDNGGQYEIYSAQAGAAVAAVTGVGWSGTRRIGIKVVSGMATAVVDGVDVLGPIAVSDTGGGPGIGGYLVTGSATIDNVSGGNSAGGGGSPTLTPFSLKTEGGKYLLTEGGHQLLGKHLV